MRKLRQHVALVCHIGRVYRLADVCALGIVRNDGLLTLALAEVASFEALAVLFGLDLCRMRRLMGGSYDLDFA